MSEFFNPLEHLVARKDAANQIQWEFLEKNGLPVHKIGPDGRMHKVLVAKRYLPVNAFRQWFYSKYPDGSIFIEDLTPAPIVNAGSFIEWPYLKMLVTLFSDQEHTKIISTGYGTFARTRRYDPSKEMSYVEPSESTDNYLLCQALAIKNAMVNAGFIVDYNEDILQADDAQFLEFECAKLDKAPSEFIPVSMEFPEPLVSEPGHVETTEKLESIKVLTKEDIKEFAGPKVVEETVKAAEIPVKAEVKKTAYPSFKEDPVLSFLGGKEEPVAASSEEVTVESEETEDIQSDVPTSDPAEVIFSLADGVSSNAITDALVGKKISEIDPDKIRYFAKKANLGRILSKETIKAIVAVS